jgi:hypothetical protein
MKRFLIPIVVLIMFALSSCVSTLEYTKLENRIAKLEKDVKLKGLEAAGTSFRPYSGGLGTGANALGKTTGTVDKDAAVVITNDDATWGNAAMFFSLDVDGGATAAAPYVVDSGDGGNEDWELVDVYGYKLYGHIPFLSITSSCTIGADCDGTKVRLAWGGIIQNTVTAQVVTLPEIVASAPTAIQVVPGASICVMNKDANETTTIQSHANDKITLGGVQSSADRYIISTGSATSINIYACLLADAADNWTVMGYSGTWTAE